MRRPITATGLLLAALAVTGARAEPLAKEICDTHKAEQDGLVAGGVKDDLAKSPAWGRANLDRDRLAKVQRFIELEEQLLFRCGHVRSRYVAPPELADVPAVPEPAKAAPKPKAKPRPKAAAAPEPSAGTNVTPAKTTRVKPKPKTDDAFRPPVAEPKE